MRIGRFRPHGADALPGSAHPCRAGRYRRWRDRSAPPRPRRVRQRRHRPALTRQRFANARGQGGVVFDEQNAHGAPQGWSGGEACYARPVAGVPAARSVDLLAAAPWGRMRANSRLARRAQARPAKRPAPAPASPARAPRSPPAPPARVARDPRSWDECRPRTGWSTDRRCRRDRARRPRRRQ